MRRRVLAALALAWARRPFAAEAADRADIGDVADRADGSVDVHRKTIVWPALTLLDGQTLGAEAWNDTAAVVVFWATWCPFCRRHNAQIEKLYRAAAGPHLRILAVALDGDEASVRRYMAVNGLHFPVVVGRPELRTLFTPRRVIPMTCLVDRRGRLRQAIPGEMAEDDVLALAALARPAG
jgi:thiol-disulfide isomerase/thioredoxin